MIQISKEHFHLVSSLVDRVDYNKLFARAVIDNTVSGRVYVDRIKDPQTCYIVHRYGMSLLCGDHTNAGFNRTFCDYAMTKGKGDSPTEWMQVFPGAWNDVFKGLLNNVDTRINFTFDVLRYRAFRDTITGNSRIRIVQVDADLFEKMNGSVVPKFFWDSFEDFNAKGIGFALFYDDGLAATSFSSFLAPGQLELGIETLPRFRGMGLAEIICSALIDHCLANDLEPLWACRLGNTGSYKLAKKLGFVPVREMAYYKLGSANVGERSSVSSN